ncbi:MAG TPA: efflux RND transporter periplasmic adaptor subunit, partial [Phycisphaerae bacterium]|nr:efflux RND transporter periplasmic adaptor subunit [Phycisphaerae bacterium]
MPRQGGWELGMRIISVLMIFAVAVGFCGCRKEKPVPAQPLPAVTAARPIQKEVIRHVYFTGRLDSFARVDITARVEGFLQKINFQDGDMVKKGQLLFEIEQDQYSALVEQAQGQLKSVIAQHNDADVNYKRIQYAFKQNVATSQELSDALAKFEVTAAEMETKDGMLKQAQINLGYTKVYSPIDGMAGKHLVDVGNLVGYGQPTLLVTVIQQDPLYVYFEVSEQNLLLYRKFLRSPKNNKNVEIDHVDLAVRLAGETGYTHKGKLDLTFEGNAVNSSTGTITWRGILENRNRLMTPGMFARVQLPIIKMKNTLLVPQVAVGKDLTGNYVFVVGSDNVIEQRHV